MARIRLDRDMPDGGASAPTRTVDEQTRAAAMRAASAAVPAAQKAIAKTPDELLLDRVNTQINKLTEKVSAVTPKNETPEQRLARIRAERETTQAGENPNNPMPKEDPGPGMYWANYGGVWRKYKYITNPVLNGKGGGGGGGGGDSDSTSSTVTLVSTETDAYGNVIGIYSDGTSKTLIASGNKYKSTVDVDAYTLLESTFKDFGLEELIPDIKRFMEEGLGSNQAAVELRKTTAYITRFRGNEIRRQAGLNVVSEATYLELENSYNETLRAYGLQGYFGVDRKVSQAKMADIIGNDISATEFKDRIDTVVTRVNNSDPNIKATLKSFYNIQDEDLVKYFLNPKENLPKLQEKVLSAEIGSEAIKQNLLTDVTSATALAQLGITKAQAREGYQGISEVLPTATKLGQIYGEEGISYTQKTAEQEVFGQLESAKRKRLKLAEKEVGSFSGAAGLARGALGNSNSSAF